MCFYKIKGHDYYIVMRFRGLILVLFLFYKRVEGMSQMTGLKNMLQELECQEHWNEG